MATYWGSTSFNYDMPPDRDFVLDSIPGYDNITMVIGAGHAFKFSALFGRILSELAVDGVTASDISPFRFDRPVMHMTNPPTNFMMV